MIKSIITYVLVYNSNINNNFDIHTDAGHDQPGELFSQHVKPILFYSIKLKN